MRVVSAAIVAANSWQMATWTDGGGPASPIVFDAESVRGCPHAGVFNRG